MFSAFHTPSSFSSSSPPSLVSAAAGHLGPIGEESHAVEHRRGAFQQCHLLSGLQIPQPNVLRGAPVGHLWGGIRNGIFSLNAQFKKESDERQEMLLSLSPHSLITPHSLLPTPTLMTIHSPSVHTWRDGNARHLPSLRRLSHNLSFLPPSSPLSHTLTLKPSGEMAMLVTLPPGGSLSTRQQGDQSDSL
jgi:hypothetical protein